MTSIITTETIKAASEVTSALPVANSVVTTMSETAKGMSTATKIAISVGAVGVLTVGGVVIYKTVKKHKAKKASKVSEKSAPEKNLEDWDEEEEFEEGVPTSVEETDFSRLHHIGVATVKELYRRGYTDKAVLMQMITTICEDFIAKTGENVTVGFRFVQAVVDTGIKAAEDEKENPQTGDKNDEKK